jgi:hypothetical protein
VYQDKTGVREIKLMFRQAFGADVVATYSQVPEAKGLKKARFNVGSENASLIAHPLTEPGRDRAATASNFQAGPTFIYTQPLQVTNGLGIVERRQLSIPNPCAFIRAAKDITRVSWDLDLGWGGHRSFFV